MSVFPNFSNVPSYVKAEIDRRKANPMIVNGLNAWVRIASGVGDGLVMYSNPKYSLFEAAGDGYVGSIYGNSKQSGTIGTTWGGGVVRGGTGDIPYKPKPNITSIEIDEGAGSISRKANFTITCYTLGQLDEICKYFLEPGFTVFLEWGWNRKQALVGFQNLSVSYVSQYQNFSEVNKRRELTKGNYDNYLGFITGGGVSIGDSSWDVKVELTGFTELPAYFMAADNVYNEDGTAGKDVEENSNTFSSLAISSATDLGQKRFMMMFNQLPSNRRTGNVANFINNKDIANPINFINFDDSVKDALNDLTDGAWWGGDSDAAVSEGGEDVEFPSGTKIVDDNKFIKFGVLMDIFNTIGAVGYKIGDKKVNFRINTKSTPVGAFPEIFSANKAKLFIPNPKTPKFDLEAIATSGNFQQSYSGIKDNTVEYGGKSVTFPSKDAISNGSAGQYGQLFYKPAGTESLYVDAEYWGMVDDLYVNFDFAKGIMETKNFFMKDALYQILNGMSSAAGGMWDFQIIEHSMNGGANVELRVVDLNLRSKKYQDPTVTFEVFGADSVFMDASLDLSMSGAKMNQVISQRLSAKVNSSQATTKGALFAKGLQDKVLNKIEELSQIPFSNIKQAEGGGDSDEDKKIRERNIQTFLQKVGIYPKVKLLKGDISGDIDSLTYISSLDDLALFDSKKAGSDVILENAGGTSQLFPINFSFTIHGVSGIKRGDKFRVRGIPKTYAESGFFQVLSVKHMIDGMTWKTEVTGGFRQKLKAAQ